jgi:alkanesulfonate monooxygenase SsuD/methylene tetrahydromethanopterin reductase-like flavin-dependent oxidoreductase (luciferase family)
VELCVTTEPQQGSCYADVVRFAREVERQGFAGLFLADHLLPIDSLAAWPRPKGPLDVWATLAGLARETERIRLSALCTPITFPPPAWNCQVQRRHRGDVGHPRAVDQQTNALAERH